MESPITNKEFENWETKGASVFTKGNIVLVPEVVDKKGAIINKAMVPNKDDWIVDLKVRIGNDAQTTKGGAGLGLYYLSDLNR
jgi:hypothetical protein